MRIYCCFLIVTLFSCNSNIDYSYIKQREWLSESGSIIRFDDKSCSLKLDTILVDGKPECIIKTLDKNNGTMEIFMLDTHKTITFSTTDNYTK